MKLTFPVSDYRQATGRKSVSPRAVMKFIQARASVKSNWVRYLGVEGESIVIEIDAPKWFRPSNTQEAAE